MSKKGRHGASFFIVKQQGSGVPDCNLFDCSSGRVLISDSLNLQITAQERMENKYSVAPSVQEQ